MILFYRMLQVLFSLIHPPYLNIFINLLMFIILTTGIIVYRFIYPKKHINLLLLALLYSVLPIWSILKQGVPESGDFTLHAVFLMDFSKSLAEGNFFPQWAAGAVGGYGYPAFEFMYLTPFYLGSFFYFLGFGYIGSIKLLLITSYMLSCITMYLWAKEEFGSFPAFVATIFYQFAPFYLIEMHFYQSVGMVLAFTMIPLAFYSLKQFFLTEQYRWFCITSVSIGLALLTHLTMATFLLPILAVYSFVLYKVHRKPFKILLLIYLALVAGLALMTYYWLPLMAESQYIMQGSSSMKAVVSEPFLDLVYSPWAYGFLFQGHHAEVKFLIGYVQWIGVLAAFCLLLNKRIPKPDRRIGWFYLVAFTVLLLLMLPVSHALWELPILNNFRSTNRLLIFEAFFAAALAALVCKYRNLLVEFATRVFMRHSKKKLASRLAPTVVIWILCCIAVSSTLLNWGNRGTLTFVTEDYLLTNASSSLMDNSLLPIWYKTNKKDTFFDSPQVNGHSSILKGTGYIKELERTTTHHSYQISANAPVTILEKTIYFPGWRVRVNNQEIPITYTTKQYPGMIVFQLPKGNFSVEVLYENSFVRQTAKSISLFTLIVFLSYPLVNYIGLKNRL